MPQSLMAHCDLCNRWFTSHASLRQHENESPRHRTYDCDDCEKQFASEQSLIDHFLQCHYYCESCSRFFNNEQSLKMHLETSAIHNKRAHKCPGKRCRKSFVSYGDMALHCESGTCKSGITRQKVNTLAVRYDKDKVITDPSRLICGPDKPKVVGVWATNASWNGQAYECFLCHKTFRDLSGLNMHLQSPIHDEKIYRCPTAYHGCNSTFTTLSALMHHVERGGCGVTRFRSQIKDALDDITSKMRRIGFK